MSPMLNRGDWLYSFVLVFTFGDLRYIAEETRSTHIHELIDVVDNTHHSPTDPSSSPPPHPLGLAHNNRERRLSFSFLGEPGYGPGVDREAWEMIAEDLVRSQPPSSLTPSATAKLPAAAPQQLLRESTAATLQMQSPTSCNAVAACSPSSTIDCGWGGASSVIDLTSIDAGADFAKHKEQHYGGVAESTMTVPNGADAVEIVPAAAMAATQIGKGSMPTNRNRGSSRGKAYFVPVDGSMSSYCPRDLVCESTVNGRVASSGKDSAGDGDSAVAWRAKGGGGADRVGKGDAYMDDLKAFEFIGVIIGANLAWEKVRRGA